MRYIIILLLLIEAANAQPMRFFQGAVGQFAPIVQRGLSVNVDAGLSTSYNNAGGASWFTTNSSGSLAFTGGTPSFSTANSGALIFNGTSQGAYFINGSGAVQIPFTLNVWFKTNNTNSCNVWAFKTNQSSSPLTWIRMAISPTNKYIEMANNGGSISFINNTTVVTMGVWYNECVTITASTISLYENGSLLQTATNSTFSSLSGFNYGELGYLSGYGQYMGANISSYSLYNVALTSTEITQNFNALRSRYGL